METVPMEIDWPQEGIAQEHDSQFPFGADEEDIPPTQPEFQYPTPEKPNEEEGKGEVAGGEKAEEAKEAGKTPAKGKGAKVTPEAREEEVVPEDLPMMTREQQQSFKDAKSKVAKMDEANLVPEKRKRCQAPALKRPAASKASRSKKDTAERIEDEPDMAMPVEPSEVIEVDGGEGIQPLNHQARFEEAAEEPGSGAKTTPSNRRGRQPKAKASPKCKASARRARAAKTTPGGTASPKLRRPRSTTPHKATPPKRKPGAKAKSKVEKENPQKPGDTNEPKGDAGAGEGEVMGKKTFAGRYCPKGGDAKLRWDCLKEVYVGSIQPKVAYSVSLLEVWFGLPPCRSCANPSGKDR